MIQSTSCMLIQYNVCIFISIIFPDLQIIIFKYIIIYRYFQVFHDHEDPEYKCYNYNYVTVPFNYVKKVLWYHDIISKSCLKFCW